MTIEDKENILKNIFKRTDILNEKDRIAVMAYIRGTKDTRERIEFEKKAKEKN